MLLLILCNAPQKVCRQMKNREQSDSVFSVIATMLLSHTQSS
jgi:hypothetical protein